MLQSVVFLPISDCTVASFKSRLLTSKWSVIESKFTKNSLTVSFCVSKKDATSDAFSKQYPRSHLCWHAMTWANGKREKDKMIRSSLLLLRSYWWKSEVCFAKIVKLALFWLRLGERERLINYRHLPNLGRDWRRCRTLRLIEESHGKARSMLQCLIGAPFYSPFLREWDWVDDGYKFIEPSIKIVYLPAAAKCLF